VIISILILGYLFWCKGSLKSGMLEDGGGKMEAGRKKGEVD